MATFGGRFSARFGSSFGSGFRRSGSWTSGGGGGKGSRTGSNSSYFQSRPAGTSDNGSHAKRTINTCNNFKTVYEDYENKASTGSLKYGSFLSAAGTGQSDITRSNSRPSLSRTSSIASQLSASSFGSDMRDKMVYRSVDRLEVKTGFDPSLYLIGESAPEESETYEASESELEEETSGDGAWLDSQVSDGIGTGTGDWLSSDATVQDSKL